ncbi:TetR/AcrR family transcriptional regulator [Limnobacter sp.]|uniref:TetR/AcrR family transcriptional regulator n=1 Tax=Limnobacter sp. TaxID=2003368 RepID=UPI002FE157BD
MDEDDLKNRCLTLAFNELDSGQINDLSLRAIARDLGVSHQAPYRHFKSKDDLLRTMTLACFRQFSETLDKRAKGNYEWKNLRSMGVAYIHYALNYPHRYRLMFNEYQAGNGMGGEVLKQVQYSFLLLRDQLELIKKSNPEAGELDPQADAMFIWSCLHGLVSLLENPLTDKLPVRESVLKNLVDHVLDRIGTGLQPRGTTQ